MDDIIVKQVMDTGGRFSHIELHQGDQYLTVSLADNSIDVQEHSYKWSVLKSIIDQMQTILDPYEDLHPKTGEN